MHVIIVGAGEVGAYLAEILAEESQDVFVIEQDEDLARTLGERLDAQVLHGSGISRAMLTRARIERADLLLAVTEIDEVNMVAAMTAERMQPKCRTVARVRNPDYLQGDDALGNEDYGIDMVLGPERALAENIVDLLAYVGPGQRSSLAGDRAVLLELPVPPHSPLAYAAHDEIATALPPQVLIVAKLATAGLSIVGGDDRFEVGDRIFVVCAPGRVGELLPLLGSERHHSKRVLVVGGGQVGFEVARALEKQRFSLTVVERDGRRAEEIAGKLTRTLVIQGDGTEPGGLRERIEEGHDAVVVLIEDDSHSLLTAIVARDLGAKKVIARVDNQAYGPIARKLGVDALISPRRAVADAILRFVRKSEVESTIMLGNHEGEVIDFAIDAASHASLVDKTLGSIKVPKNCLVVVVTSAGDFLVPARDAEARLQRGDHVLVVALREAVPKIEDLFS